MGCLHRGRRPLIAVACALLLPSGNAQAIVNGTLDPSESAVVSVGFCSGVVISPYIVLTAAECVNQTVQFGPNRDEVTVTIGPEYQDSMPTYGIAILKLRERAPATPIPVNGFGLNSHVGEEARLVGFGKTSALATDEGVRRQGPATLTDVFDGGELRLDADLASPCDGDQGGPILLTIDGVETVVGIMSEWPSGCGIGPSIGRRTDWVYEWINAFIDAFEPSARPRISIVAPLDGESVPPTFDVLVDATDDRGVRRVELWVDDELHDTEVELPFTLTSLPTVMLGPHRVEVRAFDGTRQEDRASIMVVVGTACDVDADCPVDGFCDRGFCRLGLGASCERHTDCASGLCGATDGYRFCTETCEPSPTACPTGFMCVGSDLPGAAGQCVHAKPSGGCAAAGSRDVAFPWGVFLLFALWRARSRSSEHRPR